MGCIVQKGHHPLGRALHRSNPCQILCAILQLHEKPNDVHAQQSCCARENARRMSRVYPLQHKHAVLTLTRYNPSLMLYCPCCDVVTPNNATSQRLPAIPLRAQRRSATRHRTTRPSAAAQSTQTECVKQNPHAVLSLLRCCTPTDMRSEKQDFPTLS